ncbi:DUF6602 domain-containing protein [Streptomyces sp. NPDC013161]|uniref:DUF6602 domain-containing protein n=1 Tax=Streptomyces sp. NPDC013161 TaxID=3364862 RepID=UPI0036AC344C
MNHPHELHTFLQGVTHEMRAEYERIFRRAKEDPGTAGDEGESNWARLLSDWLPADIHVATKGRILAADGTASPQVDIVLLAGDYPRKLRDKKLYLAGGVIAAFECKNTLRKEHLGKIFANAKKISELKPVRQGNFCSEAFSPIIYGLLAHSHEWSSERAASVIDAEIERLHASVAHTRHLPALICVSDLHMWGMEYGPLHPLGAATDYVKEEVKKAGKAKWSYFCDSMFMRWIPLPDYAPGEGPQVSKERPNPIGELILYLLRHLTNQDSGRFDMARYYRQAGLSGGVGSIGVRYWEPPELYSDMLMSILRGSDWSRLEKLGNDFARHLP